MEAERDGPVRGGAQLSAALWLPASGALSWRSGRGGAGCAAGRRRGRLAGLEGSGAARQRLSGCSHAQGTRRSPIGTGLPDAECAGFCPTATSCTLGQLGGVRRQPRATRRFCSAPRPGAGQDALGAHPLLDAGPGGQRHPEDKRAGAAHAIQARPARGRGHRGPAVSARRGWAC